jgi:fibronectin type 3 domain-containing protein
VESSGEIRLSFVDDVTYAYSYEVYRAADRNGPYELIAELSNDEYYCSGDTLVVVDPELLPDSTYYYYVQSIGAFYSGFISDTLALTTLPEADVFLRNREAVKIYPNPTERTVSVEIGNAADRDVYIEITDKLGLSRYHAKSTLTNGKVDLELVNLETGVYILHVTSSSGKESFRLVKR